MRKRRKRKGREEEDFRGKGKEKQWKQTGGSNQSKMKEECLEKKKRKGE
jgi:hypothetical protein